MPVVLGEVAQRLLRRSEGRGIGQNGGSNSQALGTKAQASAGLARSSSWVMFNLVGGGRRGFPSRLVLVIAPWLVVDGV